MNEARYADLRVNEERSFRVQITEEMMNHFMMMSGDVNPLHQEPDYAHARGFHDRVVYGFLTASFYSTLVGVHLPGKYALLQGVKKMNFLKPVFIGDELIVSGMIAYLNDAYKLAEIKARITNQKGEVVSDAIINVGLLL